MYLPNHFTQKDESRIRKLIEQNGFVTLLSYPKNEKPFINHLPVIWSPEPTESNVLLGHMAKRNPQWIHFKENPDCTVLAMGGHTYITPNWYKSGRDVPTWNYAVVHLYGKIELVPDFHAQIKILTQLTNFYEKSNPQPWKFDLPDDLKNESALTSSIISFKFVIEKVEAKFKLSQNRSTQDRAGIIEGLGQRQDDMSRLVRQMMIENEL